MNVAVLWLAMEMLSELQDAVDGGSKITVGAGHETGGDVRPDTFGLEWFDSPRGNEKERGRRI